MSNMSYCRFQNTDKDLRDCVDALEELTTGCVEPLSRDELEAAKRLAARCVTVVELLAQTACVVVEEMFSCEGEKYIAEALDSINEDTNTEGK